MPTAERYHQYEILRREDGSLWELGRGAMGITYKAYDTNLRFTVALKVINSAYLENDIARQRFLREARAAAGIRHSNVASVFNLGTEQDKYFYVMEYIDGETVEACVKRKGPLAPAAALNIALQVARALGVAAKQQLVHRDLKPANLMLVDQEEEPIVKVIDFGLAKVAKDAGEDSGALTMGGFVGTPRFASPEQVEEGDVDIRSDIYSLGATLYFVLTGQSPFTGSVAQVMSQQLYKPLPMAPLEGLPPSVISLLQRMMEKDREKRPQTPQDLQKAILACLEGLRASATRNEHITIEPPSAFETLDLSSSAAQPSASGVILAHGYKLIEELGEWPQGRKFLADDFRHNRRVRLLLLSPQFLSDSARLKSLEKAVQQVSSTPHPILREIYSLETVGECSLLVEEHFIGPSLLEVLRARSVLSAPEVVRLLSLLAPLADHASDHRLQHVDFTLSGIHLMDRTSTESGIQAELLQRPLTAWKPLEAKVDAIEFSFSSSGNATWAGSATRVEGAAARGPRGSCVRLLGLLAYELLGGPRNRVESTGQYTPIAALTQEGNAALRRALVDECPSASELARQMTAAVGAKGPAPPVSEARKPVIPEPLPQNLPLAGPVRVPPKYKPPKNGWRWVLAFLALMGIGGYVTYIILRPVEIAVLSVRTEPAGASVLLDGKPPQQSPGIFTHVRFADHRLTASLDGYLPVTQDIQVRAGMDPTIIVKLKLPSRPPPEIAELSVRTEPAGAAVLLDGKPPQQLPGTFTHVRLGEHQLTASLDGYLPVTQVLQIRTGMDQNITVTLQRRPPPEIAELSVRTEPSGAAVLLDGKPPQQLPGTFTHVRLGVHQLTASLDGYLPVTQDLQVRAGMDPNITVTLQRRPPPEIAELSVRTEPAGAAVLLDGKPAQQLPGTFTHVRLGEHQLTASLDGYLPVTQDLQVRAGMDPNITVTLQRRPPPEIAELSVRTEPAGAAVLLDGKPPQQLPGTFTHVRFGEHQLTASLDGYLPVTQDLQVRAGMDPNITVTLQRRSPPEIAELSVRTEPAGAAVLLDGKPAQQLPGTFTHVRFGEHQLTASLDGCEPFTEDIQVRAGMDPTILVKIPASNFEIAELTFTTEPSGGSFQLDGKPPEHPPGSFSHVRFGRHQLTASLDGYPPVTQDLQIRAGMDPSITVPMPIPSPSLPEIAELSVRTEPAGAAVMLDGKPAQPPGGNFTHVPFGKFQLTAFLDGYLPITQDLQVRAGMDKSVAVKLQASDQSTPQYLAAYVKFVTSLKSSGATNFAEHLKRLELIFAALRTKAPPLSRDEFRLSYKQSAMGAADLDIVPAIVLLGANAENDQEALILFNRAWELKKDSYAMMKIGRLYLKKRTAQDDVTGFEKLNQAYTAPTPNLEAGAYVAECYIRGTGTNPDPQKGVNMVLLLANQNVVPAMVVAGSVCLEQAEDKQAEAEHSPEPMRQKLIAQSSELARQARQWWEKGVEQGDYNALAHIGRMYEQGIAGLPKSAKEAEKRYKEGILHGNVLSKFYYGLFLVDRAPSRLKEARQLISEAASAGLLNAIRWREVNHDN